MADLLRTVQRIRAAAGEAEIPVNPLIASTMVAMGEVASEAAGKRADEQAAATPPPEITIKRAPGGQPIATIKNAPVFDPEEQKVQAKAAPREYVQEQLQASGYQLPRPQDVEEDVESFGGRYRAQRGELGRPIVPAAIRALLGARGGRDELVRTLVNLRTASEDKVFRQNVKPTIDEMQQEERIETQENRARRSVALQLVGQTNFAEAYPGMDPTDVAADIAGQAQYAEGEVPKWLQSRVATKIRQDTAKAETTRFNAFRAQSKAHFKSVDDMIRVGEGYVGRKLTDAEREMAVKDYEGEQAAMLRQEKAAQRADERLAMAIAKRDTEKPFKLTAFHAANVTVEQMLAGFGDPGIDQESLRHAASSRVGRLTEEIRKAEREIEGAKVRIAAHEKNPEFEFNQFLQTHVANLTGEIRERELQKKQAEGDLKKLQDVLGVGAVEFVSQQQWDILIASGETKESLNREGIFLKATK